MKRIPSPDKRHGIFQQPPSSPMPTSPCTTTKPKKKSKKKTIKQKRSSYLEFYSKNFNYFHKKGKGLGNAAKLASKKWKQLAAEEKESYCQDGIFTTASPGKGTKKRKVTSNVCFPSNSRTATIIPNGNTKLPVSLKGIKNNYNNCWLNSLLQCLSVTTLGDITAEDETALSSMLSSYLAFFFENFNKSNGEGTPFNPSSIIGELHKKGLRKGQQHDVHEAFSKILEVCSLDLGGEPVPSFSTFWGSVMYKNTCCACGNERQTMEDSYHSLALELPRNGKESVMLDCLREYFKEEAFTGDNQLECDPCRSKTNQTRKGTLKNLPHNFVCVLKRNDLLFNKKDHSPVQLDLSLDVSVISSSSTNPPEYKLVAAILHKGQMLNSGHYVALKILQELDTVLVFDDEKVDRKSLDYLSKRSTKKEVYMAFYRKVDGIPEKTFANTDLTKSVATSSESSNGVSTSTPIVVDDDILCDVQDNQANLDLSALDEQQPDTPPQSHGPIQTYQALDITNKDKGVAKARSLLVYGRDLKTLEYPTINDSYSLEKPGELNDTIILAYLYLIEDALESKGMRCLVYDTYFFSRLTAVLSKNIVNKAEQFTSLCKTSRLNNDFTTLDYILVPIYRPAAQHWVVGIVNVSKRVIILYDPLYDHQEECEIEAKMIKCYLAGVAIVTGHCNFFEEFDIIIDGSYQKQHDSISCGVYCLQFVRKYLDLGANVTERASMITEIISGRLNHDLVSNPIALRIEVDLEQKKQCERGSKCTFRVLAKGQGALTFMWKKQTPDGDLVTLGERSNMLCVTADVDNEASYFCEISDQSGDTVTSNSCYLTTTLLSRSVEDRVGVLLKSWHITLVRIQDTEQAIQEIKPLIKSIVQTPPSAKAVHNEFQRHLTYLNSTMTSRYIKREIQMPGLYYFAEETLDDLLQKTAHVVQTEIVDNNNIVTNDYIVSVLFPEIVIKLIQNRENCSYPEATNIAYNRKPSIKKNETIETKKEIPERSKRKGNPRKIIKHKNM